MQFFKAKERVAHLPGVKRKADYREVIEAHLTPAAAKVSA